MKVKIINGIYGHFHDGIVERKDPTSEPFEVSEEKAKFLCEQGIAEIVPGNEPVVKEEVAEKEEKPVIKQEKVAEIKEEPAETDDLEDMKFNDLEKLAKSYGLNTKPLTSKALLREAIRAKRAELSNEVIEPVPEIEAADVVD